jgi:hypothetical protein
VTCDPVEAGSARGASRWSAPRLRRSYSLGMSVIEDSHSGRQGSQGPGRDAEPGAARSAAHLLARPSAQAQRVAVSRQPVAHVEPPDYNQGALASLPEGRCSRWPGAQAHPSAHLAALLRDAPARSRSRSAYDSGPARAPRSGRDHDLSAPFQEAFECDFQAARHAAAGNIRRSDTQRISRSPLEMADIVSPRRTGFHRPQPKVDQRTA